MSFGLVSFGEALGDPVPVADVVGQYTDDVHRVLGYGYRQVHRSAPEVGLTDLAERAARQALDAAALLETAFLRASSRCLAWISAARRERWPRDSCPCGLGLTASPPAALRAGGSRPATAYAASRAPETRLRFLAASK